MKMRFVNLVPVSVLVVILGGFSATSGAESVSGSFAPDAVAQNHRLGRGMNVLGYDLIWRHRNQRRFESEFFQGDSRSRVQPCADQPPPVPRQSRSGRQDSVTNGSRRSTGLWSGPCGINFW